jgi:hypothetical protein
VGPRQFRIHAFDVVAMRLQHLAQRRTQHVVVDVRISAYRDR